MFFYLGENAKGESVFLDDSGNRSIQKDSKIIATDEPSGSNPKTSPVPSDRFKTLLEQLTLLSNRQNDGLSGIGIHAAIRAMVPYWKKHLAEKNPPTIVLDDLVSVREALDELILEIGCVTSD